MLANSYCMKLVCVQNKAGDFQPCSLLFRLFPRYSPTLSDQQMKLISILIRVQILRAQCYKYVAVYRKTENTIIVEPLIVWLFFQAVSHIAHKCQSFVNAIPQWQKQFLLSANVVPMHANWKQTSKERCFSSCLSLFPYRAQNLPSLLFLSTNITLSTY